MVKLCSLAVRLAWDLQDDFFPYFSKFLNVIVSILSDRSQDPDAIEKCFSALAGLMDKLSEVMKKNIPAVYL